VRLTPVCGAFARRGQARIGASETVCGIVERDAARQFEAGGHVRWGSPGPRTAEQEALLHKTFEDRSIRLAARPYAAAIELNSRPLSKQ